MKLLPQRIVAPFTILIAFSIWVCGLAIFGFFLPKLMSQEVLTSSFSTLAHVALPMLLVICWVVYCSVKGGISRLLWNEPHLVDTVHGGARRPPFAPLEPDITGRAESGLDIEPEADPIAPRVRRRADFIWWALTLTVAFALTLHVFISLRHTTVTLPTFTAGLLTVLLAATGQELLVRGYLLVQLRKANLPEAAVIVATSVTGCLWQGGLFVLSLPPSHILNMMLISLLAGPLLYGMRRATGHLTLPVLAHCAYLIATNVL